MDENIYKCRNRIAYDFEDHFNYQTVSQVQISFARHYLKNLMGIDIDSESIIEFSSINSIIFGYLVAHIANEYEEFNKRKMEDWFKSLPPDEE